MIEFNLSDYVYDFHWVPEERVKFFIKKLKDDLAFDLGVAGIRQEDLISIMKRIDKSAGLKLIEEGK